MAMIFEVEYPGGERVHAIGYPGGILKVTDVPGGPEAAYADEVEVDFGTSPARVLRVVGGPRRPTLRVRLEHADEAERDAWMDARETEGWVTREAPGDPREVWVAAHDEGLDVDGLICLAREFRATLRST